MRNFLTSSSADIMQVLCIDIVSSWGYCEAMSERSDVKYYVGTLSTLTTL
jgi:hypothetical protein